MKPFDIELAKQNHPVQTRDGRSARIICYDSKSNQPIIALIDVDGVEVPFNFTIEGRFYTYEKEHSLDLVMAINKKEGWVNIYSNKKIGGIYDTKEEALKNATKVLELKATKKIEWEE